MNTDQWYEVPLLSEERKVVKCGVCSQEVPILEWMQHMGKEHNYLAWQDGSPPLVCLFTRELKSPIYYELVNFFL